MKEYANEDSSLTEKSWFVFADTATIHKSRAVAEALEDLSIT
jgi:hypothetical protein